MGAVEKLKRKVQLREAERAKEKKEDKEEDSDDDDDSSSDSDDEKKKKEAAELAKKEAAAKAAPVDRQMSVLDSTRAKTISFEEVLALGKQSEAASSSSSASASATKEEEEDDDFHAAFMAQMKAMRQGEAETKVEA